MEWVQLLAFLFMSCINCFRADQFVFPSHGPLIYVSFYSCICIIEDILLSFWNFSGISDVAEAYIAAIKGASAESQEVLPQTSMQEKANSFSEHLRDDQTTALSKIQDGLDFLSYVVVSTSVPAA